MITSSLVPNCANISVRTLGYHAGHIRSIFRLPERLRGLYPVPLVYLELFTPFNGHLSPMHRMHTTSHDRFEG
jgi:hypothetical protein